ncbi:hypothetical protein MPSEU_001070900 [Mayamaea pseudoterrestris]|nr:hypothetical protein MPSEU_001070900 [Mayamaea pseudoterrestris]
MPSEESVVQQAEEWKTKGNEAFAKACYEEAISAYAQGIVALDRTTGTNTTWSQVKATLLSNRAMCFLKTMQLQECIDDCTTALSSNPESKLHGKLLFRRAKASFLLSNVSITQQSGSNNNELLQTAAKDLLTLLNDEPSNQEATKLLQTIRIQHKQGATATTPIAKKLEALRQDNCSDTQMEQYIKMLLGLLENDPSHAPMELGRLAGVDNLLYLALNHSSTKAAVLALTCLSSAGAKPEFVRQYLVHTQVQLKDMLLKQVASYFENSTAQFSSETIVSILAILVRILLHADRDDPHSDISGKTLIDHKNLVEMTNAALKMHNDKTVIRAVLDVISTWTAGKDRDTMVRASLGPNVKDPLLPLPKAKAELDSMSPQNYAAHQKRTYDKRVRDEAQLYERALYYMEHGLESLLGAGACCEDHVVRREITVVVSRICAGLEDHEQLKSVLRRFLQDSPSTSDNADTEQTLGVVIEEVGDKEDEGKVVDVADDESPMKPVTLETKMQRAIITTALLMSNKECGAWALGSGWPTSQIDLPDLIESDDLRAMCLASEVISAAATLETAADMIKRFIDGGSMAKLVTHSNRDIRSGAASAVAKLGLSNREKQQDELELMTLLQGACDLLEDRSDAEKNKAAKARAEGMKSEHFSSFASSSVERGIEMINYLVANTSIKEELAAGYHCDVGMKHSAMDRLVEICDMPMAGESLSGFALASIFQYMAVMNQVLRKEMFEGKEYTMEQFDQMQEMGKTEEEKEILHQQTSDSDTQASCDERIRKMAAASVPHALVNLIEGASEHTLEQIILTVSRMACEQSTRGILIQQGVLSAMIKMEKQEQPTDSDTMKKLTRHARHSIAKMLITQNPSMLTSAQRLGSIKPLLQLVRDIHGSDLQHFEALMALTNIAGSGDDAKNRIVIEKGIGPLHYLMFSDHEMVQQAATEALSNLIPHEAMMEHLKVPDNLRLWLAFAEDYEGRYECSRAAAGALAMATQDSEIARVLVDLAKFDESMTSMLQSGRLEIMHRVFVLLNNLVRQGGPCLTKAETSGSVAFVKAFLDEFHLGSDLDFPPEEKALLPVIVNLGKDIVRIAEYAKGQ